MDKTMYMINFTVSEYVEWLMDYMGYTEQDAEEMAKMMGMTEETIARIACGESFDSAMQHDM